MPPNRDYRKKWYKCGRRKVGIGGVKVYLCLTLPIGRIAVIDWMNLEELLFIIQEAWHKENIPL
jgi:hypothetical protein